MASAIPVRFHLYSSPCMGIMKSQCDQLPVGSALHPYRRRWGVESRSNLNSFSQGFISQLLSSVLNCHDYVLINTQDRLSSKILPWDQLVRFV